LDDHDVKDIAKARARSNATVRTQFQPIISKTGSRMRAELMGNTIAVSQFFRDIGQVATVTRHPDKRRIEDAGF